MNPQTTLTHKNTRLHHIKTQVVKHRVLLPANMLDCDIQIVLQSSGRDTAIERAYVALRFLKAVYWGKCILHAKSNTPEDFASAVLYIKKMSNKLTARARANLLPPEEVQRLLKALTNKAEKLGNKKVMRPM